MTVDHNVHLVAENGGTRELVIAWMMAGSPIHMLCMAYGFSHFWCTLGALIYSMFFNCLVFT